MLTPTPAERAIVNPLLQRFDAKMDRLGLFHDTVQRAIAASAPLKPLIHSMRARIKDRGHLQDKLLRKLRECQAKNQPFSITPDNLHTKINDLAGVRLLHLHTSQAKQIHDHLHDLMTGAGYRFREGPEARTWDIEYEAIFKEMGFRTKRSETLYTSVHYVISDQVPDLKMTCELQVRTLAEEIWGEVDHLVNYPHPTGSVACHQQIRALARSTSAAGRLVDAIFATVADEANKAVQSASLQKRTKVADTKGARADRSRKRKSK